MYEINVSYSPLSLFSLREGDGGCRAGDAALRARHRGVRRPVVDAVRDPLDDSVWVRMSSWPAAQEALAAVVTHGLSALERSDSRLQVAGWGSRLLRRRLGMLLAGVDDLREEREATAELACYYRDRRAAAGQEPEQWDVLADVEVAMRRAVPIPHRAPATADIDTCCSSSRPPRTPTSN
jgi:hypothetical protein